MFGVYIPMIPHVWMSGYFCLFESNFSYLGEFDPVCFFVVIVVTSDFKSLKVVFVAKVVNIGSIDRT